MQTVLDAIEVIYKAGLDAAVWPDALQRIADCFDDIGAVLMFQRDDGGIGTIVSPSLEAAQRDYDRHWRDKDLRTLRGLERGFLTRLDAVTDRHLITAEEIGSHPIYTEFLAAHGLRWFAAVSILPHPKNAVWISVQRRDTKPAFSDAELELLIRLGRHAETALRIGIRLLNAETMNASLIQVLSAMDCGVALLDDANRIVFKTAKVDEALAEGLSLQSAVEPQRRRTGNRAASPHDLAERSSTRPVLVHRRAGKPFVLHVLPVHPESAGAFAVLGRVRTVVVVLDAARNANPDPSLLRDLFGLTLAEARVAALVGTGATPQKAAENLGIAEDTVRKALKSIFAKTSVSRQTELALLLSRISITPAEIGLK